MRNRMTPAGSVEVMDETFAEFANAITTTSSKYIEERSQGDPMKALSMQAAVSKAMILCGTINLGRSFLIEDDEMNHVRRLVEQHLRAVSDYGMTCRVAKRAMKEEHGDAK